MSLPSPEIIRTRIATIQNNDIRHCLMACYLWAARITEVVGEMLPKDRGGSFQRIARGPSPEDVRLDKYEGENVALFSIKTAKRQGLKRIIALPLDAKYEPWTMPLYQYFLGKAGRKYVFELNRQQVWRGAREAFKGLTYPIERYALWKDGGFVKHVDRHPNPFTIHALRHLRATELVEYYGFDGFNLATYGGWTYHSMAGTTSMMDRYLTLQWQSYFPKLLKPRSSPTPSPPTP